MKFDIPSDYPLSSLYYFSGETLLAVRRQLKKLISILNQNGFEECHLPFLVPKSILLIYDGLVPLDNFIKVYSGKSRQSYAYLRPNGIFSQGITLASKMIKSYRNLPLKLFETSPGYMKIKSRNNEHNIFISPEQSFSIQAAIFTEGNQGNKHFQQLIPNLLKKLALTYITKTSKFSKTKVIQYFIKFNNNRVEIARLYIYGQEITKRANIYFFNKTGVSDFPYMYSFSLSQNIFLVKILSDKRKGSQIG